ncbi:Tma19p [Sporobolomyces salmoneus]|uniref:Tma19p n=1 Tax=Sporobolomyces salmoneus TaxID=183962 RepID=UPI003176F562
MLLYTDIFTGDELISSAYDLKEVDGVIYEADCHMITIKEGDVDIGANASAEEAPEELAEGEQLVNNIIHSFRLTETQFDKKSYLTYLKGYMKAVKAKLQETGRDAEVEAFEKGAQTFAKKVVGNFKDYQFYIGDSMLPEGMVALLNFRSDGVTPYLSFWKHGLKEMKL